MNKQEQGKKAHAKGRNYEYRKAEELTKYFNDLCGAEFKRRGGQEKHKWAWRGDIVCKKKFVCGSECVLANIHWEMKFRKHPQVMRYWEKTKDDAETSTPVLIVNDGETEIAVVEPKFLYSLLYGAKENEK